jgi:hypothetical protein
VLPAVWEKLSPADRLLLSPCLLQAASSDPSAECRTAAQAARDSLRIPVHSLTRPLVATSCSVNALAATEPAQLLELFSSLLPTARLENGKRRKLSVAGDSVATGASVAGAAVALDSANMSSFKNLAQQLLKEKSESSSTVLACMGWEHDESGPEGCYPPWLEKVLAAVYNLLSHEVTAAAPVAATCMHIRTRICEKLLEESMPVLEALQSWRPPRQEQEEEDGARALPVRQVLSALQVRRICACDDA